MEEISENDGRKEKMSKRKNQEVLSWKVIKAVRAGEPWAQKVVLDHFAKRIRKYTTYTVRDGMGNYVTTYHDDWLQHEIEAEILMNVHKFRMA
jgi:hypothetical protein